MIEFTGNMNVPNYTCLTTDITAGVFSGTNASGVAVKAEPGRVVFVTDSEEWLIVRADGVLVPYSLPVEVTASIGAVSVDQPLDDSIEIAPVYDTHSVTAPGSAEALESVDIYCISVLVSPKAGNFGNVYFGDADVDKTTSKQIVIVPTSAPISIDAPLGYKLNLHKFYIDADTGGDGVNFIYLAE
jgi:hypothetical protein